MEQILAFIFITAMWVSALVFVGRQERKEHFGLKVFGYIAIFYVLAAVIMIALALAAPITILVLDVTLFANPTVIGICVIAALFFGGLGYLTFIRPYVIYRKLPDVLAETDGEFLYIHGKKEAKIPLSDVSNVTVYTNLPYILQQGFLREFIIHIFSSNYGEIELDIPGYGDYKLPFVANVEDVSAEVVKFLDENGNTGL